jgi:hypothetical protein
MPKKQAIPEDCMPRCASCVFFVIEPKDEIGECHKNPPFILMDEEGLGYCFPIVPPEEWCGAFQRRLSA